MYQVSSVALMFYIFFSFLNYASDHRTVKKHLICDENPVDVMNIKVLLLQPQLSLNLITYLALPQMLNI